jgi:DNA polymerase V
MPQIYYALVDCNSFFVSCEKLFRPDLVDKPVVVLSNNDGVVVSRSVEAKRLGIPMGEPYFKIERLVKHGGLVAFSSNFRLYGDMRNRVMQTLMQWTPDVEVYSIDEAFLKFANPKLADPSQLLNEIATTVKRWTGIPVSVGLGSTMTLAKVANDVAKKHGGTFNMLDTEQRDAALAALAIADVWGIGRHLAPKMTRLGINTAADLAAIDPIWIRKHFSVVQEKLVRELRGENCLTMDETPQPRKNIQVSRSFRNTTNDIETLSEAVSTFASKACEKARRQGSVASGVYVHINTSRYNQKFATDGIAQGFSKPTANTPEVIRVVNKLLKQIFREGYEYKKATVVLMELRDADAERSQSLLFNLDNKNQAVREKEERLMQTIDAINDKVGRRVMQFGAEGTTKNWQAASDHSSPSYTSKWEELPLAVAR